MELTKIWEIIQRRKWIIIQAIFIISLVALIGSHFISSSYETSSKIMIKSASKTKLDEGNIGLSSISSIITASTGVDVNKILAVSKPITDKMINKLQLRDLEGNLIAPLTLTQTGMVSNLKRKIFPQPHISISQYQMTDILQIIAGSPEPEEAMMMANTLAEIMVNENQKQMRAEYKSARIFLTDQIRQVKNRYNDALRNLMNFRKKEKTLDLAMETKLATEKMAELLEQKEDNIIDLAEARAELALLKKQLTKQSPESLTASTIKENPHIEILKKRLTDLKLDLSEASTDVTDKHPKIQSLKQQIKTVEAELKRETSTYQSSAPQLAALERQIAALEVHLQGVNTGIEKYFKSLGRLPEKAFNQAHLDMELNISQRVYGTLLDALYQVGIAEASTLSEIKVIDPAVKPLIPVSPNKRANGILGLFAGLVFGLGLAFVIEYLVDTINSADDIEEYKPMTPIVAIPKVPRKKSPLISNRDHNDPFFECYRTISTHLQLSSEKPLKSLLITCAGPGEGKSTTVINLGISMASEGKQVVLLDMDLRRPQIHNYLQLPNDLGAADILEGSVSIDAAVQKTQINGLSVITSGPPRLDPGSLMEAAPMKKFINDLKSRYDLVIVDSAPMLVKSDALILSKYIAGSLIVLESGKTTRRAFSILMEIITKSNIKPFSFVLNKVPIEKGKYYYHRYY